MIRPDVIIIEGHVQGLSNLRSVTKSGAITWVIDKNTCIASHSKYCKKFLRCPEYDSPDFIEFLLELGTKYKLSNCVLLPSNDHAVVNIALHRSRLLSFYNLPGYDHKTIQQICDKKSLLKLAERLQIPIPQTEYFENPEWVINSSLTFPTLTKGRFGLTFYKRIGRKAVVSRDVNELQMNLAEIGNSISLEHTFTQEIIPLGTTNKTISFAAFSVQGEIRVFWMGEKIREHPSRFGTATAAVSVFRKDCLDHSEKLIRELNYTGICEIEYLQDPRDGRFMLIEINPRTWLWVGLAKDCGVDFAKYLYYYCRDIPVTYPSSYQEQVMWYNPITDFFYSLLYSITLRLSPIQYIRSFFLFKTRNALFERGDYRPGFAYVLSILRILKTR
jgi:D-aspartate ligase